MTVRRRPRLAPSVVERLPDPDARVERRLEAAARIVAGDSAVAARVAASPSGYVLAQSSSDLARHAALLEPLPAADEVRVVVTPGREAGTWNLDLATLDRPGLLARFTGVLLHAGVDVVQAVLATWSDGAALQALVVRGVDAPDAGSLQTALRWALDQPLAAPPVDGAAVRFDDPAGSYTGCEVVAADRPGLLHAVAVAIALAGADIHAASVRTDDGVARDRFDLTDPRGRPLDPGVEAVIAAHLAAGARQPAGSRRQRS